MNRLFFLFLVIVLFACCGKSVSSGGSERLHKQQLINAVRQKAAMQLKTERGLSPCGSGAQAMDDIVMLALSFFYYKPLEVNEARVLLLASVDDFIAVVNAEERIYPYLKDRPFEPKNIELRVFIQNPDGSEIVAGKLCCVSALNGILHYKIWDPKTGDLTTLYRETYEEARLRASGNPTGLPELKPEPPRKPLESHKGLGIGFCS